MASERKSPRPSTETAALYTLLGFTVVSLLGYGTYGLHPELMPDTDIARRVFAVSFQLFARIHIVLAAVVLAVVLFLRLGVSWVLPFGVVSAISFMAEHIGTGYGVPFGGYEYTGLLGTRLGGRVPILIPVSWFLMALPCWVIARSALGANASVVGRISLAAVWLVTWDVALDPAMSYLTPYWRWAEAGPYYGMPWVNLLGWFTTGLTLMVVIESFSSTVRWEVLDVTWMAGYYGAMVLMPLGMLIAAGLWPAVAATLVALAGASSLTVWLTVRGRAGRAETDLPPTVVQT